MGQIFKTRIQYEEPTIVEVIGEILIIDGLENIKLFMYTDSDGLHHVVEFKTGHTLADGDSKETAIGQINDRISRYTILGIEKRINEILAGYGGEPLNIDSRPVKSLIELENERWPWSEKTFPEATPLSSLCKLREEIKEIEQDLSQGNLYPEEYADAMMCLLDSAKRAGITVEEILLAYELKTEKNKKRKWSKNPDNSYSHIK